MAILAQGVDYTDKDFDSIRLRLFALIESVFPTWTARQVANFGNMLVEQRAFVAGVLLKYQDNQARESRWSQATQRKSLLALTKMLPFEAGTATASQVDVTLSIVAAATGDLLFEAGVVCRTRGVSPVQFRILSDTTLQAGQTQIIGVTAENSESIQDIFTSPGTPDLEVELSATPYIDGSVIVIAGNGVFTEVDNFLDSTSSDLHFTVLVDQNDRATLRFGDGIAGQVPTGTITADYKIGGGTQGQVEATTVAVIEGVFIPEGEANPVQVTCVNPAASTTAVNRDSTALIREQAPLSLRVLTRTVAREDYEILAKTVTGVSRALMLTSDQDTAIQENSGFLFIIPTGGGVPTQALKDAVEAKVTVEFPNTLTFNLTVSDSLFLVVNVSTTVFPEIGANPTTLDTAIRANLAAFFAIEGEDGLANPDIDYGFNFIEETGDPVGELPWSDIQNVIRDTIGVKKMEPGEAGLLLNGARDDVTLLLREFPTLGSVQILNGNTGSPLV